MRKLFLGTVALAVWFVVGSAYAAALKPFVTDGCTGFANGTRKEPNLWLHCCEEHDLRYWFGGSPEDMAFADDMLRACVNEVAGPKWAKIIYDGVVAGHSSPVKSKYHWSWAWVPERDDIPLTRSEVKYVKTELRKLPLEPTYIESFIQKYLP